MTGISSSFICKCGKTEGWIKDGEEHPNPCPVCGRRYRGVYNDKTFHIEAVEIPRPDATEVKHG